MAFRLQGFDYTRPYFYMVTLRKLPGVPPFCQIADLPEQHWTIPNEYTRIFAEEIRHFHETWQCVEPITCFAIMPDHLHLLLKIRDITKRLSLPRIVWLLRRRLEAAAPGGLTAPGGAGASRTLTAGHHLFEVDWHDWIVKRDGQLAAFTHYIRENAERSWRRQANRENFRRIQGVRFLGREWFGYGNPDLLNLPVIEPFRCSRSWSENGPEWNAALTRASRIGPGGAGIGTFMSPCEKACGRAIGMAGGRWIVLSPEGFGKRWHPGRNHEPFCADGRMLYLSLYPAMAREPPKAELYRRCHEMGDVIVSQLAPGGAGASGTLTAPGGAGASGTLTAPGGAGASGTLTAPGGAGASNTPKETP